jgi:hypothetical protein
MSSASKASSFSAASKLWIAARTQYVDEGLDLLRRGPDRLHPALTRLAFREQALTAPLDLRAMAFELCEVGLIPDAWRAAPRFPTRRATLPSRRYPRPAEPAQ